MELLAKDYIASFKSVHDLEQLGVEGRRPRRSRRDGRLRG
jgi:hypothetical protein